MLWDVIQAIATQQYGLITRWQLLEAGATDAWIQWAVGGGRLKRVRRGVYSTAGAPPHRQAIMAACLAAGSSGAVSHLAAAALRGAEQVLGDRLELTTFDDRDHRLAGVITHRSKLDAARAITSHEYLPVVVPALTVVQVAQTCHPHLVKSVANDLVKRNWTDFQDILDWVDLSDRRHRQALRELCLRALDVGGHDNSPAARDLCARLKEAGAADFAVDYQVDTLDGIVLVDIAWPPDRLGLEYNGGRDHDGPLARDDDDRRRNTLVAMGWRILDANRGMTHEEIIRWVVQDTGGRHRPPPTAPRPRPASAASSSREAVHWPPRRGDS